MQVSTRDFIISRVTKIRSSFSQIILWINKKKSCSVQIILILSKSSTQTCVLTSNKSPLLSVRTYKNNTIIDSSEHHEFNSAFILSKQPFISTFHLENLFFFHFFWDSSHIKLSNCYPNWNFIQIFRIYYTKWMFWYKKIQSFLCKSLRFFILINFHIYLYVLCNLRN